MMDFVRNSARMAVYRLESNPETKGLYRDLLEHIDAVIRLLCDRPIFLGKNDE